MMGFYENDCKSDHHRKKGIWEAVAFVYDKAAKTQTIVVNGAVVKTCADRAPFEGTDTVYLGRWATDRGEWKGQISNVKIFNRALTAAQIDAMQGKKCTFLHLLLFYSVCYMHTLTFIYMLYVQ